MMWQIFEYPMMWRMSLKDLLKSFPAVVVTGARQVGKSTLAKHVLGDKAGYVVFDPLVDVAGARQDPDLFLENRRVPLILDEVQYAPEVVAAVKRRIDRNRRPGQYLLTGSQQWGVLRSVAESLAGRAVFLNLEGFSLAETRKAPGSSWLAAWLKSPGGFATTRSARFKGGRSVYEQVWRGWLPEAQFLPMKALSDFHASYQRAYIERDVRMMANVSDWQLFGRFVRLCAALTAQEINHSEMGRELGLHYETAHRWLDTLKAAFQWHEVPAWSGNPLKRVTGKPKGYFMDTGVACTAQTVSTPDSLGGHPLWGPLFETAILGEVRKQAGLLSPPPAIWHWRAHSGAEVDILLERDGTLYPIEVKAGSNPGPHDASGIAAFRAAHSRRRIAKGLVVAPMEQVVRLTEDDYAIPWDLEA
jgi:predicted AAA+ superfamily ATPase